MGAERDDGEFGRFWHEHRDGVRRALAVSIGDLELATEATDEAFTRAYQRWSDVRTYDEPAGWCYRVGRNWATSRWRKVWRRRDHRDVPEVATWDGHRDADLEAALAALPERQHQVVVLRHLVGCSTRETARVLGVPEGTVKSDLHRALARLRETLGVRT